jgi:adenine-specific DNA-methyltransferase
MKKLTAGDPETMSPDLLSANLEQLKALFPDLVTEGANGVAVNVDVLKALVGDNTVTDTDEKYGLNWHGKRQARQLSLMPSTGTLRPCPNESVDWDLTKNLLIEGDNLEVLKLLQKSYTGKVKLVYIDPPYNTGGDFVYPDNFGNTIAKYLELTGQMGEKVGKLSSNTESSGRFHADWLSMIFPRLRLSRNLLREDGVIFVSIDDNEQASLRRVMDEIFGEENFVAQFVWRKKRVWGRGAEHVIPQTEYIICYAKSVDALQPFSQRLSEKDMERYTESDDEGPYYLAPLEHSSPKGAYERKTLQYSLVINGQEIYCGSGQWLWSNERAQAEYLGGNLEIRTDKLGRNRAYKKIRPSLEDGELTGNQPISLIDDPKITTNASASRIKKLFGDRVFDFSKPVELIEYILSFSTQKDSLILDFFAGSGTTGEAVYIANARDAKKRRFILCQLPEPLNQDGSEQAAAAKFCRSIGRPQNIAELTKERLRRASRSIREENPLFEADLGFRAFTLDSSNIRAWEPDPEDLEQTILDYTEHIKEDRTEQDILYELLLKFGLDLCVSIEQKELAGKVVYSLGGGVLLACLAPEITSADVEPLALGLVEWHQLLAPAGDATCVFRDSAFTDDVAKTNLSAILNQHGISNVRSL